MTREQALNYLKSNGFSKEQIQAIVEALGKEPRKGHWIEKCGGNNNSYYECSLCGCLAPSTEFADRTLWKLSNFCPDCGADMGEEKE